MDRSIKEVAEKSEYRRVDALLPRAPKCGPPQTSISWRLQCQDYRCYTSISFFRPLTGPLMQPARLSVPPQLLNLPWNSRLTLHAFLRLPGELRPIALHTFTTTTYHQLQQPAPRVDSLLPHSTSHTAQLSSPQSLQYGGLHKPDSDRPVVQQAEVHEVDSNQTSLNESNGLDSVMRRRREKWPPFVRKVGPSTVDIFRRINV